MDIVKVWATTIFVHDNARVQLVQVLDSEHGV